jgi:hypothetical protein
MNPRLSDFSYDQLRLSVHVYMKERAVIEAHLLGLKQFPSLQRMFEKEILEGESQICDLNELITQFSYAMACKEEEMRVASN